MSLESLFPTPDSVLASIIQYTGGAPIFAAWGEIRRHLHEFSADGRMLRSRDEIMTDLWRDLWDQLRANAAATAQLRSDTAMRFLDHEAMGVLTNFLEDAYREPMDDRRKMLAHAAAGLTNAALTVAEYARVWRSLGELDPGDIDTLYALWLVPTRLFPESQGHGDVLFKELQRRGGDALEACNAVVVRTRSGAGIGGVQFAEITRTGIVILTGLRSFLFARDRPVGIPGHDVRGGRSEEDARAMLGAAHDLIPITAAYCNHRFDRSALQFDGAGPEAPPTSNSKLVLRGVTAEEAEALARALPPNPASDDFHVERLSVDLCQPMYQKPDLREVHVVGPFNVLRWLAYDLNAGWA